MKCVNICLLVLSVLSGTVGLFYLIFDPIVRSIVLNKLTLSRTSETFYIWEDPPISPHLKVYFWNFTNPQAFFNGSEKPILQEVGPYTYRQHWLKQNITWHDNGTISYRTRKIFKFEASESCSVCDDEFNNITILNVPAISAYYQMRDSYFVTSNLLKGLIRVLGYNMWTTKSPKEFLWGHKETLFHLASVINPLPFEKFGFFLQKNTSREEELGMYTMYTGQGDPYKLANIASFNGRQSLGRWNDSECDKVHGSDGASFNPYIQKKDTLWFFNDQMCRAMPLVFDKEVVREGLPGYRFGPREDVFMSPERYPQQNACFGGEGKVTGDGVFDVTTCQFDAPIVLSWPHFLHAESKFTDKIIGMSPDKEQHGFWFDIQPTTGTTLSAKARVQINVMVRHSTLYNDLSMVNDTVVPVLWFEEGIDKLGDDIIHVLRGAAVAPGVYRQYILYCFFGLFSTLILFGIIAMVITCKNHAIQKVREVQDILASGTPSDHEQAVQPMLDTFTESTDSSYANTATHSRNCSEGARPPYVNEVNAEKLLEKLPQLVVARTPPYSAIQVDESLLDGEDQDDRDEEDEEELPEGEDGEDDEDGMEQTVVLIQSRIRQTSTASVT